MLSFWIHTSFLPTDDDGVRLSKFELDGPIKKDKRHAVFDVVRFHF